MKKMAIFVAVLIFYLSGCTESGVNDKQVPNEQTECDAPQVIIDGECTANPFDVLKSDLNPELIDELSNPYYELVYYDETMAMYLKEETLLIDYLDKAREVKVLPLYTVEQNKRISVGYDKEKHILYVRDYNGIEHINLDTLNDTRIINGQDMLTVGDNGGVAMYAKEAVVYSKFAEVIETIAFDEYYYMSDKEILFYDNQDGQCFYYHYDGSTRVTEETISSECNEIVGIINGYTIVLTDNHLVSIDQVGNMYKTNISMSGFLEVSINGHVIRFVNSNGATYYDELVNKLDNSLYGSLIIYDFDETYFYGEDPTYGWVKTNRTTWSDYYQYETDYYQIKLVGNFVFQYDDLGEVDQGNVYNQNNDMVLQGVIRFTMIDADHALYFKRTGELYEAYIYHIDTDSSTKIEGYLGRTSFKVQDDFVYFVENTAYLYHSINNTEFKGEYVVYVYHIDSEMVLKLTGLTSKQNIIYQDELGNLYQLD